MVFLLTIYGKQFPFVPGGNIVITIAHIITQKKISLINATCVVTFTLQQKHQMDENVPFLD